MRSLYFITLQPLSLHILIRFRLEICDRFIRRRNDSVDGCHHNYYAI